MRNGIQLQDTLLRATTALLMIGFLGSAAGCSTWELGAEKNIVKNGIEFETYRETDHGSKVGMLVRDTVIDGWPCKRGFIAFREDWSVDELQLSRDYERNGIFMPEGTWVFANRQGIPKTCMFPHDVKIQGYLCRGSWLGKQGWMTEFYDSGKLSMFWSREPVTIDAITCTDSMTHGIHLHENGRLKRCKLDKLAIVEGVEYRKGTIVCFDQMGRVTTTVQAQQSPEKFSGPKSRIGTFDSRAVASAYYRSESFNRQLREMRAEYDKAKAAGDEKRVRKLEAEGSAQQELMHKQLFSIWQVDNILEEIEEEIPKIAEQAHVGDIVSKWTMVCFPSRFEFIDVTDLLVKPFLPDEQTLRMIEEIQKQDPIALEDLKNHQN
jgi:hypothetical protein